VSQRSGVSIFFVNYTSSGPDQFFYPQNWIFLFAVLFVLARGLFGKASRAKKIAAIVVLVCLPLGLDVIDRLHHPTLQREQQAGTFQQHIKDQCATTTGPTVQVLVYPIEAQSYMTLKRSSVCK
jgi:hypothetical protein